MKKSTKLPKQGKKSARVVEPSGPTYAAPALEKGLDILETLSASNTPLSLSQIAERLDRSVSEIYRMLACLVDRNYLVNISDSYAITPKLFELAHSNPPTNRLLAEAGPIMQDLSSGLQQACHLTVYNQGRQIVIAKVDNPGGMGFSIRVGAELDVLVSASGRALLAFQDPEIIELRIKESVQRRPQHASIDIGPVLQTIRARGFESMVSLQIKGLYAVSYPILDTQSHALAALTVPYAERLDQRRRTVPEIEAALGRAAETLSGRMGWRGGDAQHFDAGSADRPAAPARKPTPPRQTASR
jgi:DNA-binding IclR family transcriptional regulator